jgi:AcrR family transcriptional regulator
LSTESAAQPKEGARERLIETGLYQFAAHGVEGARTRVLAELAGVNQSAIPYYFGGKEGMYAAVIESIADELAQGLSTHLPMVDAGQTGANRSEAEYADRLYTLIKAFALTILSPGRQTERTLLIVQEQLRPTRNFDVLFQRFVEPLHRAICGAVASLQNRRDDELLVITQAHALVGLALAFVVAQQAYLRRARCTAIGPAEAETISDTIAAMAVAAVRPARE